MFQIALPQTSLFFEDINEELLKNASMNPYAPHRILENIDMLKFCQILLENKFHESYRLTFKPTIQGFEVTRRNFVHLKQSNSLTAVKSRSCQILTGEGDASQEIFVAPASAAKIKNAEPLYEAKNTVLILSCSNTTLCTLEGTLELANLEDDFPILDMITDNNIYYDVQNSLPHFINPFHRIFTDINMTQFCADLQRFSNGFFLRSKTITEDQYDIHDKNQISHKPIYSRSCQLRRVDDTVREIVLAAPLFDDEYLYSHDTIFILSCLNRDCNLEATAIVFNLEEKYQSQHLIINYWENVLISLPGINQESGIPKEEDIADICQKIKMYSGEKYIDSELTGTNGFNEHFVTLTLDQPYIESTILARSCPLIVNQTDEEIQIKIAASSTSTSTSTWNPSNTQVISVAILECQHSGNMCRHIRTLVVKDIDSENPEITMLDVYTPNTFDNRSHQITGMKRPLDRDESSHASTSANRNKRSNTHFPVGDSERETEMQQLVESPLGDANYWSHMYQQLSNSPHNATQADTDFQDDEDYMFDVWWQQAQSSELDASSALPTSKSQPHS